MCLGNLYNHLYNLSANEYFFTFDFNMNIGFFFDNYCICYKLVISHQGFVDKNKFAEQTNDSIKDLFVCL